MAAQFQGNTEGEMLGAEQCTSHEEQEKCIKDLNHGLESRRKEIKEMKAKCQHMMEEVEEKSEQKLLSLQHQRDRTEIERRDEMRRIDSVINSLKKEEDEIYALHRSSDNVDYSDSKKFENLKSQMEDHISSPLPRVQTFTQLQGRVKRLHSSSSFSSSNVHQQGEEVFLGQGSSWDTVPSIGPSHAPMSGPCTSGSCAKRRGRPSSLNQTTPGRDRSSSRDRAERIQRTECPLSAVRETASSGSYSPQELSPPPSLDLAIMDPQSTSCEYEGGSRRTHTGPDITPTCRSRAVFQLSDDEDITPGACSDGGGITLDGNCSPGKSDRGDQDNHASGEKRMEETTYKGRPMPAGVQSIHRLGDNGGRGESSSGSRSSTPSLPPSQSREVRDLVLHELAEKWLSTKVLTPLGLKLGLKHNAIEIIEADYRGDSIRQLYQALQSWKKELTSDQPAKVHYCSLAGILCDIKLTEAADWLRRFTQND